MVNHFLLELVDYLANYYYNEQFGMWICPQSHR